MISSLIRDHGITINILQGKITHTAQAAIGRLIVALPDTQRVGEAIHVLQASGVDVQEVTL